MRNLQHTGRYKQRTATVPTQHEAVESTPQPLPLPNTFPNVQSTTSTSMAITTTVATSSTTSLTSTGGYTAEQLVGFVKDVLILLLMAKDCMAKDCKAKEPAVVLKAQDQAIQHLLTQEFDLLDDAREAYRTCDT